MPSLSAKINFMLGFEKRLPSDDSMIGDLFNKKDPITAILNLVP